MRSYRPRHILVLRSRHFSRKILCSGDTLRMSYILRYPIFCFLLNVIVSISQSHYYPMSLSDDFSWKVTGSGDENDQGMGWITYTYAYLYVLCLSMHFSLCIKLKENNLISNFQVEFWIAFPKILAIWMIYFPQPFLRLHRWVTATKTEIMNLLIILR